MKKKIKINFQYFWQGFNPKDNFFTNLLKKKYRVIISPEPDFVFYSVYPPVNPPKNIDKIGIILKKISPKLYTLSRQAFSILYLNVLGISRIPSLKGNFKTIFFAGEHISPNMNSCDWAFGSDPENKINNPRYMRLPTYLVADYQLGMKKESRMLIKRRINIDNLKKEKTKFCNFIYSQDIPERNKFFYMINSYKKVDSPGRCMNNMAPIGANDPKKSRMAKNWVSQKINFLRSYKFTIAFENADIPGWTTEKLIHPMLANSIPIYFGNDFVSSEFNTKSFINYHDFKSIEDFIKHIKNIDTNEKLWEKYLKQPWFKSNRPNKYFSEKRILLRFKKIFGY